MTLEDRATMQPVHVSPETNEKRSAMHAKENTIRKAEFEMDEVK